VGGLHGARRWSCEAEVRVAGLAETSFSTHSVEYRFSRSQINYFNKTLEPIARLAIFGQHKGGVVFALYSHHT